MGRWQRALEGLVTRRGLPDTGFWQGKRVLVTGHTGFKGGWLTLMLSELGALVSGVSDRVPTNPSLYVAADIAGALQEDLRINVTDGHALESAFQDVQPEIVFHLAAQPLVLEAARHPVETFSTNVMGTVNVLEACRRTTSVRACVVVTTDKVYLPAPLVHAHVETDALGGDEPYAASKVGAEMAAASYVALVRETGLQITTCRAGNVIGGGDWSPRRLLPDLLAALDAGGEIQLRYPQAVRPWQHVLDPLTGYVLLAEDLSAVGGGELPRCWNFGPKDSDARTVLDVVNAVENVSGMTLKVTELRGPVVETRYLALSSERAERGLGWSPAWDFYSSVEQTVKWHLAWRSGGDMGSQSRECVLDHLNRLAGV